MSGREQVKPKYRGIWDKAQTGRSMKSAIKVMCLICMNCETKAIRDCGQEHICPLWKYRPYQTNPYKVKRGNLQQNLHRVHTGQIARKSTKGPICVTKDIQIPKGHKGRLRVSIELPESREANESDTKND